MLLVCKFYPFGTDFYFEGAKLTFVCAAVGRYKCYGIKFRSNNHVVILPFLAVSYEQVQKYSKRLYQFLCCTKIYGGSK